MVERAGIGAVGGWLTKIISNSSGAHRVCRNRSSSSSSFRNRPYYCHGPRLRLENMKVLTKRLASVEVLTGAERNSAEANNGEQDGNMWERNWGVSQRRGVWVAGSYWTTSDQTKKSPSSRKVTNCFRRSLASFRNNNSCYDL